MTKRVRIENADSNVGHKVFVQHQEQYAEGWKTVHAHEVHPFEIFEVAIHSGKRIVVSESPE